MSKISRQRRKKRRKTGHTRDASGFFHTFTHSCHFFIPLILLKNIDNYTFLMLIYHLSLWSNCIHNTCKLWQANILYILRIISPFILSRTVVCYFFCVCVNVRCYKHTFAHLRNKQYCNIIFDSFVCISIKNIISLPQRKRKLEFLYNIKKNDASKFLVFSEICTQVF